MRLSTDFLCFSGKVTQCGLEEFHHFKATKKQITELGSFLKGKDAQVPYEIVYDNNVERKSELCSFTDFKNRSLCSGNLSGMVLLPDGKVTLCEELYWNKDFIIGDLTKNNILEVWQSEKALRLWDLQQSSLSDDNPCKTCQDFTSCRKGLGVCWKAIIAYYGKDKYLYPDPRCPKAPEPIYNAYYESL